MNEAVSSRKLTTILAADVAGYSRLVSLDEEGAIASLRAHRSELVDPLIERSGGRIANTAGDSILAEFPSVVDAVRCAIIMQDGMAERNSEVPPDEQVNFRIGINVGDVFAEGDDLLGDGVNVAARLESLAPAGGICLSRSARDQIRHLLEFNLEDLGEIEVKNIDRRVRAFRLLRDGEAAFGAPPPAAVARRRPPVVLAAAVVCAVGVAAVWQSGLYARLTGEGNPPQATVDPVSLRPAMIVLPFTNMSDDPEQEYFSDGLTEDLTTALSRIPGLLVTARNTAFNYKGRPVDARSLGAELGVRYMLEGSARKLGDRLRLNVQLIETANGNHVWAERFDRPLADLFIVQDELVDRIVGSVASRLRRHEGERALLASTELLAAYDLTSRARLQFRQNSQESIREARSLLLRATELDPRYAQAFATLAQVENYFFTSRVSDEYANPDTARKVIEAAARAATLAPENASARAINGMALRLTGDYEAAAVEAKRARELAPNDPDVLVGISAVLVGVGDYEATVEAVRTAMALDPYINPLHVGVIMAQALFALGDFEASRAAALYCLKRSPRDVRCHESLVRALGELGPPEEAAVAAQELLTLSPDYTVSEYKRRATRNRRDAAAVERWAEGLRKAGIPD